MESGLEFSFAALFSCMFYVDSRPYPVILRCLSLLLSSCRSSRNRTRTAMETETCVTINMEMKLVKNMNPMLF